MFKIHISRKTPELLRYIEAGPPPREAIISIVDDLPPCVARYPVERGIQLSFADVNEPAMWGAMTLEQAEAIHAFVMDVKDDIDVLNIHCFAGQSRSPGIAAAILRGLGFDDSWIWNDKQYRPNPLCLALVEEAFHAGRILFTADMHIGDERMLDYRPQFTSTEQMERSIADNWNAVVEERDTVYIAGDIAFQDAKMTREYLMRLKGKKMLLLGDCDYEKLLSLPRNRTCFADVKERMWVSNAGRYLTICHYPMLAWNCSARSNSYMLHGHLCNKRDDSYEIIRTRLPRVLNCGMDINGFRPVSFEQLVRNNAIWYGRNVGS